MNATFGFGTGIRPIAFEPVKKGWSEDEKYRVTAEDGKVFLLRLSDASKIEAKRKEFDMIRTFFASGIRMNEPLEFGIAGDGKKVFMLLSWVSGRDLEGALPELSEAEQYELGREAGRILKKLHSIPLAPEDVPSGTKKEKKLLQLKKYEESSVRVPGDGPVVRFVRENIDLIWREPPVYLHGDFHPGNLIYCPDGRLGVIDFNRWEIGDPYEEFYKLESFSREISVPFCRGQIDAYFGGGAPKEFWETLAVYSAHASLYSIKWAEKFGQEDIDGMIRRYRSAMEDFEGFTRVVPRWLR